MAILTSSQISEVVNRGERVFDNRYTSTEKDIDKASEVPLSDPTLPPPIQYFGADANAIGIMGKAVSTTAPTNNQIIKYNSSQDKWLFVPDDAGVSAVWGGITGTLADQTDLQTVLNAKSTIASPAFTGTPTAPTASSGTNTNQLATTAFVRTEVSNLLNSAPAALDTLNELASALGNDANFSTTITNSLALKAPLASPTFTGTVNSGASIITSAANPAFAVGPAGASNPTLAVNCSVASQVTGLLVTGAAAGGGVTIAGSGSGNNNITVTPTGTGVTVFSSTVRGSAGASSSPSFSFVGDTNTGFMQGSGNGGAAGDIWVVSAAGINASFTSGGLRIKSDRSLCWAATSVDGVCDTGWARLSAGAIRGTNGSTGAGQLLIGTSTDTADAQLSVYSQSPTRPSLKLNMPSGTSGTQETFGVYNNGTKTLGITAAGTIVGDTTTPNLSLTNAGGAILSYGTTSIFAGSIARIDTASTARFGVYSDGTIAINSTGNFGWSSGAPTGTALDVVLARDAANTLAQRNGTNAQAFRIYNTTDAGLTNYERAFARWSSNVFEIGTDSAGTGVVRNLRLAANSVLVASNFLFNTDNAYDIGASGATRPRNLYIAGDAIVGGSVIPSVRLYTGSSAPFFLKASSDNVTLYNAAGSSMGLLQFGGTTSSFPSIKRNAAAIDFRLADDSNYASINAGGATFSTTVIISGDLFVSATSIMGWTSRSHVRSNTNGNLTLYNSAGTDFGLVQLGGVTASFPAIKRNAAGIDFRLADDTAYAAVTASTFTAGTSVLGSSSLTLAGTSILFNSGGIINYSPTLLAFNGTTASFPALKRSSTSLQVRLADDSDDAPLTTLTVKTKALTVATLPAAATAGAGARAFVTDANATHAAGIGTTVAGGGANSVPVYSNGTNWLIG